MALPDRDPRYEIDNRFDIRNPKVWILMHGYDRDICLSDGWIIHVSIPPGFDHDGASIPRPFRNILSRWGRHSLAALCHDWLYAHRIGRRKDADLVFKEAMKEDGVSFIIRWVMYFAVRIGGWKAWYT